MIQCIKIFNSLQISSVTPAKALHPFQPTSKLPLPQRSAAQTALGISHRLLSSSDPSSGQPTSPRRSRGSPVSEQCLPGAAGFLRKRHAWSRPPQDGVRPYFCTSLTVLGRCKRQCLHMLWAGWACMIRYVHKVAEGESHFLIVAFICSTGLS